MEYIPPYPLHHVMIVHKDIYLMTKSWLGFHAYSILGVFIGQSWANDEAWLPYSKGPELGWFEYHENEEHPAPRSQNHSCQSPLWKW